MSAANPSEGAIHFTANNGANQYNAPGGKITIIKVVSPPGVTWPVLHQASAMPIGGGPTAAESSASTARLGHPVGECDPMALEVQSAIQVPGQATIGVLPGYVPRAHDRLLRDLADAMLTDGRSRLITLVGESSTGKTRAGWELAAYLDQQQPGQWRLWHPYDPTHSQAALNGLRHADPHTIVWLNEAQLYFRHSDHRLGEQVAAGLRTLVSESDRAPILVLATLWPDHWAALTDRSSAVHRQACELLRFGTKVRVEETFTADELRSLTSVGIDARLRYAAKHAAGGRIIQYVAGAPILEDRYREAPRAARAVLQVAMDARRLGYPHHLPQTLLEHAAHDYLSDDNGDPPGGNLCDWGDDWFERALEYATAPCTGARGTLTRTQVRPSGSPRSGEPHYELAGYLEQLGHIERGGTYPPESLWKTFANTFPDTGALLVLGDEAIRRGRLQHAAALLAEGAASGDRGSAKRLAHLLQRRGRVDEAYPWWRFAAEAGDVTAMVTFGAHLESQGDTDGAILWWTTAAEAGSQEAPCRIAYHLHLAGRDDDARDWWRRANAAHGGEDYWADSTVMGFLLREGRSDEAKAWAPRRMSYSGAMTRWPELARLLHRQGRTDEAITCWKKYIKSTDPDYADHDAALHQMSTAMLEAGQTEGLLTWLREHAERGYVEGKHELVRQLVGLGRVNDAVAWLTDYAARHPRSNDDTAERVADLLLADGRPDDAMAALRSAAAADDPAALARGVAMMQAARRPQQAFDWLVDSELQSLTNASPVRTLCLMGMALRAAGHQSLALLLLQAAADVCGSFFWIPYRPVEITPVRALQMWEDAYAALSPGDLAFATFLVDDAGVYPDLLQRLSAPGTEADAQWKSADGEVLLSEEADALQVMDWLHTVVPENGSGVSWPDRAARLAARSGFEAEALATYERVGLRYQQAELLEKMGRIDDVVKLLLGGHSSIDPDQPLLHWQIAELLYRTRGIEEAIAFIRHDHSAVARLYADAGYHQEAITAWRLSADHGAEHALDEVVALLHSQGKPHDARHLNLYGWETDGALASPWAAPRPPATSP